MDKVEGTVLEVGETRTVATRYGERELAELTLLVDGEPTKVTLWGDWAETAGYVEQGHTVAVLNPNVTENEGRTGYATGEDSRVVVEPSYLVNATDVRAWVQCPRIEYLNKLTGVPLKYEVVRGTVVHGVFEDMLNGEEVEGSVDERVRDAGLELGLLGREADGVRDEVREHARAVEGWLEQTRLGDGDDGWRTEKTLFDASLGMKGRADALRADSPVELKTGSCDGDARFKDKIQTACYALMLQTNPQTGVVLYTGTDGAPAREFRLSDGLLDFALRKRNEVAASETAGRTPTGHEANADCSRCFEYDTCTVVAGRLDQESKAGTVGEPLPDEERDYFEEQHAVLEQERRAVHDEHSSLSDDEGALEVRVRDAEPLADGGWRLELSRTSDEPTRITEGDLVLVSDGDPSKDAETAWVRDVTADAVAVRVGERIDATRIDAYPSTVTVDRYMVALHDFVLKADERRRDVLLGRASPGFDGTASDGTYIENNEAQDRAVARSVAARDLSLIQGPPGTGKTHTVARLVRALVDRGERVLLSSFTNRAVDNALEALLEQGYDGFVRLGTRDGVRADMLEHRFDEAGEPTERASALRDASVVACTTATCASRVMREQGFDYAVVDEASQLTEPATLSAVNLASTFVLVGDHEQLPPVSASEAPSMFERLADKYPESAVTLRRQYRMAQRIQSFSSKEFYDGALFPADDEVARRSIEDIADPPDRYSDPVTFVPVDGEERQNVNVDEAEAVEAVHAELVDSGVPSGSIAVIAPFRAQVAELGRRLPDETPVDTVDRFQGSSQDTVVLSFVASDDLDSPVFDDPRRLNVALTRAKRALVLVGNPDALRTDPFCSRLLDWAV
ncbi:AAA domain-containing protein [Haladaptatus sp. F3-133]|uniref:DNA helicase n=1 Tax=Halorutilus salinus TaxID=2487751 RepID=A0A9Q4C7F0_9EURY|nr:AAA domain-containing protein [Halorutilus salinus]